MVVLVIVSVPSGVMVMLVSCSGSSIVSFRYQCRTVSGGPVPVQLRVREDEARTLTGDEVMLVMLGLPTWEQYHHDHHHCYYDYHHYDYSYYDYGEYHHDYHHCYYDYHHYDYSYYDYYQHDTIAMGTAIMETC